VSKTYYDTLIVGQGLAGSLLARQLMQRGQRLLVVDDEHLSSSSMVAAGLINPVTGKRLVKTLGVDACLPVARRSYRELEQLLGQQLLVDKPMLRLMHGEAERARWLQRTEEPGYAQYLGALLAPGQLPSPLKASHGGGLQLQTAYLRTVPLLRGMRDWLAGQQGYLQRHLAYDELLIDESGVSWGGLRAKRVIFCEGYKGKDNPWFRWLPFQPAKGEFLTVRSRAPLPDIIINSGRWLMPRGDGNYRVGASYDHQQLDETITSEARQSLLDALPGFLEALPRFEVVSQQAGVRPTTSDRQPFIGTHPHYPQLMIFNGFGSKGSLLIPWHAERFADFLHTATPLPPQVDIQRYRERFGG
jgi:glycine/D-amino acid oxidase-like deaminating enzyme